MTHKTMGGAGPAFAAGLLLLAVLGLLVSPQLAGWIEARNQARMAREAVELDRARWQLEYQQWHTAATAPAGIAFAYGATGLALVALTGLVLMLGDAYRQRRVPLVRPDQAGRYPLARPALEDADRAERLALRALELLAAGEVARAVHQPGQTPASLHYSPHITLDRSHQAALPAPVETLDQAGGPVAPPLVELIASGFTPTRDRLLLGYSSTGPLYGGLNALLSTAIAGRPGQGKSTLLRFVYWQVAAIGGELAILDPHGSILEDVPGSAARLVASTGRELDAAAALLLGELDQRMNRYRAGERQFTPYLALLDELPVVSLSSGAMVEAAGRLVLEGRKTGMYCLVSGQGLPAERFGGRLVRDALSSRFIFKTSAAEARRAGLVGDAARLVEGLVPGQCVIEGPVNPQVVAIPMTTASDVRPVDGYKPPVDGYKLGEHTPPAPPPDRPCIGHVSAIDVGHVPAPERGKLASPEAQRVAGLFLAGYDPAAIVAELSEGKVTSRSGGAYQVELRRVLTLLREAMRG